MLAYNNLAGRGCWLPSEDQQLHDNVKKYGTNWKKVSQDMSRTVHGCRNRWHILTGKRIARNNQSKQYNHNKQYTKDHPITIIEKGKINSSYRKAPRLSNSHIDLSNRDIIFENNNNISPTNTPTATTNSTTTINNRFINIDHNEKRSKIYNDGNNNINNYTISNLKRGTTATITTNVNTIYEFMDRLKIITTTNWTINDIYQLMIIMSHIDKNNNDMYFTNVLDWNDIGMKINKNCYDCENVWKLVKNELSENVVGEIMKHNWKTTGF